MDVLKGTQQADQEAKPRKSNAERVYIEEIGPEALRGTKTRNRKGLGKMETVVVVRRR
jgi:hypothetical protein